MLFRSCRSGRPILCPNLRGYGCQVNGFFAEYALAAERLVYSTEGLDPDTAVFTEPASCATHGTDNLRIRPGQTALVFGAGPTGLLLSQLIKASGAASVTVAAPKQFKLDVAKGLGIDQTVLIDRKDMAGAQRAAMAASGGLGYEYIRNVVFAPRPGDYTPDGADLVGKRIFFPPADTRAATRHPAVFTGPPWPKVVAWDPVNRVLTIDQPAKATGSWSTANSGSSTNLDAGFYACYVPIWHCLFKFTNNSQAGTNPWQFSGRMTGYNFETPLLSLYENYDGVTVVR